MTSQSPTPPSSPTTKNISSLEEKLTPVHLSPEVAKSLIQSLNPLKYFSDMNGIINDAGGEVIGYVGHQNHNPNLQCSFCAEFGHVIRNCVIKQKLASLKYPNIQLEYFQETP